MRAFHPRGGQVEQRHPGRVGLGVKMPGGEFLLDPVLPLGQPVHRRVELIGRGRRGVQVLTKDDMRSANAAAV
jgi:hypothetical protein